MFWCTYIRIINFKGFRLDQWVHLDCWLFTFLSLSSTEAPLGFPLKIAIILLFGMQWTMERGKTLWFFPLPAFLWHKETVWRREGFWSSQRRAPIVACEHRRIFSCRFSPPVILSETTRNTSVFAGYTLSCWMQLLQVMGMQSCCTPFINLCNTGYKIATIQRFKYAKFNNLKSYQVIFEEPVTKLTVKHCVPKQCRGK